MQQGHAPALHKSKHCLRNGAMSSIYRIPGMPALTQVIKASAWEKELLNQVLEFTQVEESSSVYLSKLKESEN